MLKLRLKEFYFKQKEISLEAKCFFNINNKINKQNSLKLNIVYVEICTGI